MKIVTYLIFNDIVYLECYVIDILLLSNKSSYNNNDLWLLQANLL